MPEGLFGGTLSFELTEARHATAMAAAVRVIERGTSVYAPQPQPPLGLGKYTKSCIISLAFLIWGQLCALWRLYFYYIVPGVGFVVLGRGVGVGL